MHQKPSKDRRIQRTKALLRGALGKLVREKPYEDIVVKEILNRANVGRSAFYTHFGDKDELLISCIHEMLGSTPSTDSLAGSTSAHSHILRFSRLTFDHIEQHRGSGQGTIGPRGGGPALHDRLQHAIEAELRMALLQGNPKGKPAPPDLLARWIASTFVLVLNWWVESNSPLPACEADRLFRRLVEPSLSDGLG